MPPATDFDRAFPIIWRRENGADAIVSTDSAKDPGGYTRGGIALKYHPELTRAMLDAMTKTDFYQYYQATYWFPPNCDALPWPLNLVVFDGEVNAGDEGAIALQAALGVVKDGNIGPLTLSAVAKYNPTDLTMRTLYEREQYYRASKNWDTYGRGWTARMYLNMYEAGKVTQPRI